MVAVTGSSEQSVRVTYRATTLLCDPSASMKVGVHEGQTQAAKSFCTWLVATCVFSSLLLDNVKMDMNMLLI